MSAVDNPVDKPLVCDQMCAEIDQANSDLGAALVAARAEVERMRLVFDAARVYRQAHRPPCSGSGMDEARVILFAAVDGLLPFPAPRKQRPDVPHVPVSPPEHSPVEMCRCGKRWPCPGAPTQTGSAPQDVTQVSADEPGRGGHATSGPSNQPTESVS